MLKWFSSDEAGQNEAALAAQEGSSSQSVVEVTEQLAQTQQLVAQLKELIREKDNILQAKDEQLKAEKDSCETKLSKMRLQNKAKVTSLNSQLEDLKKQLSISRGSDAKSEIKKSGGDGDQEHASASRGKILLLRKKTEELEQQLLQREAELAVKAEELEAQRQRGMEMDEMLAEKNRKLAEKEAYIIDLQMTVGGDITLRTHQAQTTEEKSAGESGSVQELQLLVQNLTKKVGETEERYSLLQEQTESLKELLVNEKAQFEKKENMYKENIQTFKDIILQKDNKLLEINQMHEQELFKLAAKSDASADLEQLLKALKQKLHEKEEVLLGKGQVINVLQGEVDDKDLKIKELVEKMQRLQGEKDNMQSKLDAERHVMRAQLRDLMQKHEAEMQRVVEKHENELLEKEQLLRWHLEELRSAPAVLRGDEQLKDTATDSPVDMDTAQKLLELEAQVKLKAEEASKSEARFLKMKAWSKSRIRQLEDDLRKAQSGSSGPDMNALQNRITDLEEERQELLYKLDQYDELKSNNDQLIAKLMVYEEQQRKMQADLEQVTKRPASQTSESGSTDELQIQTLEWQDMVLESEAGRDQAREEKASMGTRMSHIEEEREVLVSRQQELEEELAQARGLRQQRGKKLGATALRSLQEDFEFDDKQSYTDPKNALESITSTEGENMGGWWPDYSTSDTGLRSVVEELELERNQLQEQILGLEERCQDLEDRLQMQARIESLQTETERLQAQLASLRSQQNREAEKHQLLVTSLNEQLRGLSETQECLETSLMEKEQILAKTSEKLEFIDSLRDALKEKETHCKEVTEKLLQAEHNLTEIIKKCSAYEKQCSDLKQSNADLTQKISVLKDKTLKQETTIVSLQSDLEQTNDELDKLNSTHLEERAQLIHDLQTCEREIDSLKDILADKDKEISVLSNNMTEYSEQIFELKREIKLKEEDLVSIETALTKTEREAQVIRDSQSSDQQALNTKITQLTEQLKIAEFELVKAKEQTDLKTREVEDLIKQIHKDDQTIQNLSGEIQKLSVNHHSHLLECESQISSLKEQVTATSLKLKDSEILISQIGETNASSDMLKAMLQDKEQTYEKELKCLKEERNQLLAEAVKNTQQMQALSKQLEEHVKGKDQVKKQISEKLEVISLLEQRLKITQEEAEKEQVKLNQELKARDSENERLQQTLQGKSETISRLELDVSNLHSANQQLKVSFEKTKEELNEQKKLIDVLNEKISMTYDQHANQKLQLASLLEENKMLQQEVACKDQDKLVFTEELNSKISVYELQHSESQKTIELLQKDKEDLAVKNEDLVKVLEKNKNSMSVMLLEKTNECSHLTKSLSESKESITQLHDQISQLNSQLVELRGSLAKKEEIILDKNADCEMQQRQLEQTVAALKAELMENESLLHQRSVEVNSLQNEVLLNKQFIAKLQTDTESLQRENLRLSQSLEEKEATLRSKTQEYEKYLNEYNKMTESIVLLRNQIDENNKTMLMLESTNRDIKNSVENQIAENIGLKEQLSLSQTEIKSLHNHLQALNEENIQLHAAIEKQKEELDEQKKLVADLNEKSHLTFEQATENKKIIQTLMKEKEELTERIEELRVLEQNKTVISESLLEKTNECNLLSKLLSESEKSLEHINSRVALLNAQIEELKVNVVEKEQIIKDQNSNCEMQQCQLGQLQETLSLLQEQGAALKTGLMEKDALLQQRDVELCSLKNEILQHKESCHQVQKDMESALHKQISDSSMLQEALSQKQTDLDELHRSFQALKEESSKLKAENLKLTAEASKTVQEIAVLQLELSNQNSGVVSLTKKLTALQEESECLHVSLQQKTESVNQQETFIKQLKDELEEGKNKMDVIASLQSQIQIMQKTVQDMERSSQEKETKLIQLKGMAVAESQVLKTQINANMETINHLQGEIKSLLEKINELKMSIAEKDSQLKNKVDDYLSLRAKYSELEDAGFNLRGEVDLLSLESIQLKKMLKEKEEALVELQNVSLANSGILNINYKAKEAECESLKERLSALQEDVSKLKDNQSIQSSQIDKLRETLVEKEASALEQMKVLQNLQIKADEAGLFKSQFIESTELVSKLQGQVQEHSLECKRLNEYVQEKQSALLNLQDKYAKCLEELGEVKNILSQKNEEVNNISKLFKDSKDSIKVAESTIDVLRNENALLREELQHAQQSHTELSKQKEEALTSHQIHASNLMVEIEGLKSQHLQVAAQVNALTQNLEQRELALHEINNQYAAQVKHGEKLVSELQKLEEENKKLKEEVSLTKALQQNLHAALSEKEYFQKSITEKEELCKSYNNQLQLLNEELQLERQQHLGRMSEAVEKMKTEKEHLQLQVSAKIEEITGLKLDIQKMTQTLQESEKEWLSVLDKEVQEKNIVTEQLRSVENKMKSNDVKVQALQQDLDTLQKKCVDVMAALNLSSDQLKNKDLEVLELSRQLLENQNHLEEILSCVHRKENEIFDLTQTLRHKEKELQTLELCKQSCEKDFREFSETMTNRLIAFEEEKNSLQSTIKQLKAHQQSEIDFLKSQLDDTGRLLQEKQCELSVKEKAYSDNNEQLSLLQDQVRCLKDAVQMRSKNLEDADINQSTILSEVQTKDDTISSMTVQLNQQKELLSALSQQLKEKDMSITQVMVSASNEMVKYTEEKNRLLSQVESLENSCNCSVKEFEKISIQLEESRVQLLLYKEQMETKDLQNKDLVKENEQLKMQQDTLCKEKEVMKKKLQAALVIRKDLLRKIDGYEKQIKENENSASAYIVMQDKLKELTLQVQTITKNHESRTDLLEQQIVQKEVVINELRQVVSKKDVLLEHMSHNMDSLQIKFDEQEENLTNTLHLLSEKSEIINRLQLSIAEKEETYDHERFKMMGEINVLREETAKKENLKSEIEKELALVKQEKTVLEKKAYAALLARKEIMKKSQDGEERHTQEFSQLKEEFNKLLEQHNQQMSQLNAVQVKYDEKVNELENVRHFVSLLEGELNSVRNLSVEKEKTQNSLSISIAERNWQGEAIIQNQTEIENLLSKLKEMKSAIANKDTLILSLEEHSKEVHLQLKRTESELEKTHDEMMKKTEKIMRLEQEISIAHEKHKYSKQEFTDKYNDLHNHFKKSQAEFEDLKHAMEIIKADKEYQYEELRKVNKELTDANFQIKKELEKAHSIIAEKSFELHNEHEKMQADSKNKQTEIKSNELYIETLEKEKNNAFTLLQDVKTEVTVLKAKLNESEELKEELLKKVSLLEERAALELDAAKELQSLKSYAKQLEVSLREKENGFVTCQELMKEKEQLIASLEQQLQREIHLHEVSMEQMKTVVNELQQKAKEAPDASVAREPTAESKQITRKLQAALISRKEALKENQSLKQQVQALRSENEEILKSSASLEKSITHLKQQKEDLESSILSLGKEKEKLVSEVDQILSENHNLSAACESLKLTIENITHQKQAFSCQLESLKDSQTVELSEWKSKHTELKQEYESLLQAYENVSSEMDKMQWLLEVTRKEKQEVLLKALQMESEKARLEKQVGDAEDAIQKMKGKMQDLTRLKQQEIQDLEAENEKMEKQMRECDEEQKRTIKNLTAKNSELEAEVNSLKTSSIEMKEKMSKFQSDNDNLVEELKVSSTLLEKCHNDSKASQLDIQLKLEETLNSNYTLTSMIESQKADIADKTEMIDFLQKEKLNMAEKIAKLQKEHDVHLNEKDSVTLKLREVVNGNIQELSSLNEKIRILEDDKSLLQEELENVQEVSEKVKNEKEYLETLLLKDAERIDELTEAVNVLQAQNNNLSAQLAISNEEKATFFRDKEQQQLKLVKEFEEKLKALQKGHEGSKSLKMELQELLKEKHQEIKQLQHHCVTYQELILELESTLKSTQSKSQMMENEMKRMNEKISSFEERTKSLEAETKSYKTQLNKARDEMANISFESEQFKVKLTNDIESQSQIIGKAHDSDYAVEQQQALHGSNFMHFVNKISELLGPKERSTDVVMELKTPIESQDLQTKRLKAEATTNLAKLAALSVSPSTDDLTKQSENMFQKTIEEKDKQLLEQGYVIMELLEDIRGKDKLENELQVTSSGLEQSLNEHTLMTAAQQKQISVIDVSNTELGQNVEFLNRQINDHSKHTEKLVHDKSLVKAQLNYQENSACEMQSTLRKLEKMLSDSESQILMAQADNDRLRVDLEKQKAISVQLKSLVQNKDSEISLLLSSRNGQMSEYLEQLQKHHRAQVEGYEARLNALYIEREKAGKEFRQLEAKVKMREIKIECALEEKAQLVEKLNFLKSSLMSLQTDKERLVSDHRILEVQHRSLREKESLVQEDLSENRRLKQEIKTLVYQMDDLHSENAMVKAQLIRYKEDLNQVLSLKDNQLKELLKKQQDSIKSILSQKTSIENQLRDALMDLQKKEETNDFYKAQNSKLASQVQELENEVFTMKKQKAEMNETKVISDLQEAVAAKAAECNDLQQKLFAQKLVIDDLRKEMQQLEDNASNKLAEARAKYKNELDAFEQELDLTRNERETAENRVAELAKELIQTEQLFSKARSRCQATEAQNQSLAKAMAALQGDRDHLIEDFKVLRNKYDDELRETTAALSKIERQLSDTNSELIGLTKERYILIQKLSAFESDNAHSQLTKQIDELCCIISDKEAELHRLSKENEMYSKQMAAFSGSMASLQDDRDRLIQELADAKRVFESREGENPSTTTPMGSEELSLNISFDVLQTERDRLLKEVESLKSENAEFEKALQEAQVYKQQTEVDIRMYLAELAELKSERTKIISEYQSFKQQDVVALAEQGNVALLGADLSSEQLPQLLAERSQLQNDLHRCLQEIHQRDLQFQQINTKLLQTVEEKMGLASQLKTVSQTLRDTQLNLGDLQNRCYWLESQIQTFSGQAYQGHAPGAVIPEVPPGAPQERSVALVEMDRPQPSELRSRLVEVEQQLLSAQHDVTQLTESLTEERARRQAAEEALGIAEENAKRMNASVSRASQREFTIHLESDDEREALIIDPSENVVTRKMKGGVLSCKRWLRGRSLYCSKLLTSRAKSRYLFLVYQLTLHVIVFMCLTGFF